VEHALREKEFIYQLNRLNVSIIRARSKALVFLSRTLLKPPIQALDIPHVEDGIAYMQGLMHWIERGSKTVEMEPERTASPRIGDEQPVKRERRSPGLPRYGLMSPWQMDPDRCAVSASGSSRSSIVQVQDPQRRTDPSSLHAERAFQPRPSP
jgi:hypothetical protein